MMNIKEKLGFSHIEWREDHLYILDQRLLPNTEKYIKVRTIEDTAEIIANLTVRGAPLIGVTAAYGLCLLDNYRDDELFQKACELLINARPTAVNLEWSVKRMSGVYRKNITDKNLKEILINEAVQIHDEDILMCENIGRTGNEIVPQKCRILTHCNAGSLATGGIGTALSVIYTAHFAGKEIEVWVDETRPVLQGARLTAWELNKAGVPFKLITDSMSGSLMSRGMIDIIVVGADRIAKNYDFANKIGTYNLAVLADYHDLPFYCAAPTSTYDTDCPDGNSIPIEKRDVEEIKKILGKNITPPESEAYNPAFDVTPHNLVTGIIFENKIVRPSK